MSRFLTIISFCLLMGTAHPAATAELRVAVAANFAPCLEQLAPLFEQSTGHTVVPIVGSTGRLAAQISAGAPFQVFLAANQSSCATLVAEGHALADSRFTYARGRLVLWLSQAPADTTAGLADLLALPWVKKVAMANPRLAPYGEAARQALAKLGLPADLASPTHPDGRLVLGTSVGQVWQFAASGHVQGAFLALSQVKGNDRGWHLVVPPHLHQPIRQDAVVLTGAQDPDLARAFLAFLRTPQAAAIMARFGYGVESDAS